MNRVRRKDREFLAFVGDEGCPVSVGETGTFHQRVFIGFRCRTLKTSGSTTAEDASLRGAWVRQFHSRIIVFKVLHWPNPGFFSTSARVLNL